MDAKLQQDLDGFFETYRNNTGCVVNRLPAPARQLLIEELRLCMMSVYNRIDEELRR